MPIPVLNFPINNFEQPHHERNIYRDNPEVTFERANPGMVSAAYTSDLLKNAIENQKQSVAARYMQPQMEEQLKQLRMNTDILRPQAEHAPQFTQAALAESLMKAPKMQSDINLNQANVADIFQGKIPMQQAHANYFNRAKDDVGLGVGITGQIIALERIKQKYGEDSAQYQMAKRGVESEISLKEGRGTFFTTNVGMKNLPEVNRELYMEQFYREQDRRSKSGLPAQKFDQWYAGTYSNNSPANYAGGADINTGRSATNNQLVDGSGATLGQPQQQPLDFSGMTNTAEAARYKKSGESSQINDSIQMKNAYIQMSSFDPKNLAKYAGVKGTTDYLKDVGKMLTTGKAPNEAVMEFQNFKDVAQMVIQDAERAGYKTSVTPAVLSKLDDQLKSLYAGKISPDVALRNYHTLKESIKDYAIQKLHVTRYGAAPLTEATRNTYEKEIDEETKESVKRHKELKSVADKDFAEMQKYSDKNIEYTAKLNGITVEQVKQELGIR